ncbi:MAG: hypothetical protein ACMUIE_10055 [Thermoplasmatota archaeon]
MGKREWKVRIHLILSLIILSSFTLPLEVYRGLKEGPSAISSFMDPEVWIETEQEEFDICVEPGHSDDIEVKGIIHCDFASGTPPGTEVDVTLRILSNVEYTVDLYFYFKKGEEESAPFRIIVPAPIAQPTNIELFLTLFADWFIKNTNRYGQSEMHRIFLHALPYSHLRILDLHEQYFKVGQWHRIDIEVENRGNCHTDVFVEIDSGDKLEVMLPDLKFSVRSGGIGVYPIHLKQSSGMGKDGHVSITVRSDLPGEHNVDTHEFYFKTEGKIMGFITEPLVIIPLIIIFAFLITTMIIIIKKKRKKERASGS